MTLKISQNITIILGSKSKNQGCFTYPLNPFNDPLSAPPSLCTRIALDYPVLVTSYTFAARNYGVHHCAANIIVQLTCPTIMGNQQNSSMTTKQPIKAHLNTNNGRRKMTCNSINNLRAQSLCLNFKT